ncbi:MAG: YggT family protein [Syntrophomonadaceae bacterium]|nr:YggT family protein [Syntrophomonadaceae bacterium]
MGLLIQIINIAFSVLIWLVIIRCLLSFIPHNPYQPLIRFVYDVTEPIMAPFRRLIPPIGMIDISPIVVVFALELVRRVMIELIWMLLRF